MALRFHTGTSGLAGDFVVLGNPSDLNSFFAGSGATIMGWFNADSYGQGSAGHIFHKQIIDTAGWSAYLNSSGRFAFSHSTDFLTGEWVSATSSIGLGAWHHFAVVYTSGSDANDPTFYIDGVLSATTELNGPFGSWNPDTSILLTVGQRRAYDRAFDGRLADLRMYDRRLAASEIQTIFSARGTDSIVKNLVRRYRMQAPSTKGPYSAYKDSLENTESDAASITLTVPDQIDGDVMIMVVCAGGVNTTIPPNINTPTGWTLLLTADTPSAATWPSVSVFVRTASSEPSSYNITNDQAAQPWGGCILAYPGIGTTATTNTTTGTNASPVSPSVTPSNPSLVLYVALMDNEAQLPTVQGDFFPTDVAVGRHAIADGNGSENGFVLGVAEEMWDASATGTRTWSGSASDEWVGLTLAFDYGGGQEGKPGKDLSNNQANAQFWHRVVGDEDILRGC